MIEIKIHCVINLFVIFIITVANAKPALDTQWHEHKDLIPTGLYTSADHLVILNSTNLKNTIYGTKNAWVVEFYANWCPHCQRFAKIWKVLGHSIDNWKDIINVGAFDCASVENTPICREYEVMFVPTLKYFSPYSVPNKLGKAIIKSEIVEVLRDNIIDFLKDDNTSDVGWPNLSETRNFSDIFLQSPDTVKYSIIIFEKIYSYLGMTAMLDFHNVSQIVIRRVSSNNKELCDAFKVTKFPMVIAIDRENITSNLTLHESSRIAILNSIKTFMSSNGMEINVTDIMSDLKIMENYSEKKPINYTALNITLKSDDIFQADLEAALQHSLTQEIPLALNITGEKMQALKNYLEVLAEYFPLKFGPSNYLRDIYNTVKNKTSIDGWNFANIIMTLNKNTAYANSIPWVGCKGSLPYTRRYTCGLWTMFHTLSVKYAIAVDQMNLDNAIGGKIIFVMHEYVKNFFGCSHCAEHFLHMAKKQDMEDIKTADEAVLWLWKAHNEVNLRLAEELEDLEFPKLQYPDKVHCSQCRYANDTWNEMEVLNYLKEKYGGSRIKYDLILSSSN